MSFEGIFRFAPSVVEIIRTWIDDDQLTYTRFHLNKNDQIIIPFYAINRNPLYYSGLIDPVQFYLERFLNEIIMKINFLKLLKGMIQLSGNEIVWPNSLKFLRFWRISFDYRVTRSSDQIHSNSSGSDGYRLIIG